MQKITKDQIYNSIKEVSLKHVKSLYQDYLDTIKLLPPDLQDNLEARERVMLQKTFESSIVLVREVLYDLLGEDEYLS